MDGLFQNKQSARVMLASLDAAFDVLSVVPLSMLAWETWLATLCVCDTDVYWVQRIMSRPNRSQRRCSHSNCLLRRKELAFVPGCLATRE